MVQERTPNSPSGHRIAALPPETIGTVAVYQSLAVKRPYFAVKFKVCPYHLAISTVLETPPCRHEVTAVKTSRCRREGRCAALLRRCCYTTARSSPRALLSTEVAAEIRFPLIADFSCRRGGDSSTAMKDYR